MDADWHEVTKRQHLRADAAFYARDHQMLAWRIRSRPMFCRCPNGHHGADARDVVGKNGNAEVGRKLDLVDRERRMDARNKREPTR